MRVFQHNVTKSAIATRGFSLVELLTVVVIAGILLAAAVPALTPADALKARQTARNVVAGQIRRGQSQAILSGQEVALVFVGYDSSVPGSGGRRLAVVELERNAKAGGSEIWKAIGRWESLPGNLIFMDQDTSGSSEMTLFDSEKQISFIYRGKKVSGPYLRFDRRGAVVHPPRGVPLNLVFGQGTLASGVVTATKRDNDGNPVFELIRINRLNGRTRIPHMSD